MQTLKKQLSPDTGGMWLQDDALLDERGREDSALTLGGEGKKGNAPSHQQQGLA